MAINSLIVGAMLFIVYYLLQKLGTSIKTLTLFLIIANGLILALFIGTPFLLVSSQSINPGYSPVVGNLVLPIHNLKVKEAILLIYTAVFIIKFSLLFRENHLWKQLQKLNTANAPAAWQDLLNQWCKKLNLKTPPRLKLSGFATSPLSTGILKPVILFPIAAINQLSIKEVEMILLHELAHFKHQDRFSNLLIQITEMLLWFNPFTNLFCQQLRNHRELLADDFVLSLGTPPLPYVETLYKIASTSKASSLAIYYSQSQPMGLFQRVARILYPGTAYSSLYTKKTGGLWPFFAGLLAILVIIQIKTDKNLNQSKPANGTIAVVGYKKGPSPEQLAIIPNKASKPTLPNTASSTKPKKRAAAPTVILNEMAEIDSSLKQVSRSIAVIDSASYAYLSQLEFAYNLAHPEFRTSYQEADTVLALQNKDVSLDLISDLPPDLIIERLLTKKNELKIEAGLLLMEYKNLNSRSKPAEKLGTKPRRIDL